ncbi:mitochondrial glutathione transporter SLC25A39 [Hyperolius riggenbachi]|uniref:mitochondrial glutathione transporter SLC25A39 n=1 Tax=Hyperolius riggenbachi TaxID=752182 RepID=UPI0035A2C227
MAAVEESGASRCAITPLQQIVASGTGALLTSLFVTPLDVVKIRLQSQKKPLTRVMSVKSLPWAPPTRQPNWRCFLYCNGLMDHLFVCQHATACSTWYRAPTYFNGTLKGDVIVYSCRPAEDTCSVLVMAVPATIIYFTCYDQLRDFLYYGLGYSGSHIPLVAGALSRLGAVSVISPLELIRTKMQSRQLSYMELGACLRSAVSQGGWLSLWKGWGPTVLRDVPFSALYWFNYELVKKKLNKSWGASGNQFLINFTSGAVSGAVAAVLTLPFDVVKTHRQIELGDMDLGSSKRRGSSTWGAMRRIRAESGTRGLYAGFMPRVIKVAPACAIMISSYEFGKKFFEERNLEILKSL